MESIIDVRQLPSL